VNLKTAAKLPGAFESPKGHWIIWMDPEKTARVGPNWVIFGSNFRDRKNYFPGPGYAKIFHKFIPFIRFITNFQTGFNNKT